MVIWRISEMDWDQTRSGRNPPKDAVVGGAGGINNGNLSLNGGIARRWRETVVRMNHLNQRIWDHEGKQTLQKPENSDPFRIMALRWFGLVEVLLLPSLLTLKMEPAAADVASGWPLSRHRAMSDIKMQAGGGCTKGCPSVCFSLLLISISMLFFLGTPALCIHMETTESHSEFSCEPIRLRMCQDLPYNTTFMPNLLHHYDQQTAALAMEVSLGDAARVNDAYSSVLLCCHV